MLLPILPWGHAGIFLEHLPKMALSSETKRMGNSLIRVVGVNKLVLGKTYLFPENIFSQLYPLLFSKQA